MFSLEKPIRGHNAAKEIRDTYAEYFLNEGQFSGNGTSVEWRGF